MIVSPLVQIAIVSIQLAGCSTSVDETLTFIAFLGQRQKWFALRFNGSDSDVRLDLHTPEFDAWRWARLEETPALIIPFKRPTYTEVAERFKPWTEPVS